MRLLQITVHLYDSKKAEITGDPDTSNDIPKKCAIDLDLVAAIWESFDPGLIISMQNGERFWVKDAKFEEYFHKWQGTYTASNEETKYPTDVVAPGYAIDPIDEIEHLHIYDNFKDKLAEEIRKLEEGK